MNIKSMTSGVLVFALLLAQMPTTVWGQEAIEQEEEQIDYYAEGRMAGWEYSGGGAFFGGLISGLLFSFLGWGIGYVIVSGSTVDVPGHHLRGLNRYDRRDFQEGYRAVAMRKKKSVFNHGAAIGTVTIILYFVSFRQISQAS